MFRTQLVGKLKKTYFCVKLQYTWVSGHHCATNHFRDLVWCKNLFSEQYYVNVYSKKP